MKTRSRVYLYPHLDDAVLSCGGRIWQQVRAGERVSIVTIFAGTPASGALLSPFVQELHARWGLASATVGRREEDAAALALLKAEGVYWPYADCIYRQSLDGRFLYDSEDALFGEVHPSDGVLIANLAASLRTLTLEREGTIYVPLAVGHHVDHQIVRRAAGRLRDAVVYYEDYPYAEKPGATEATLGAGRWREELLPLSPQALEAKIAAIACYGSQISSLDWVDTTGMAAAVRAFAERLGGGAPVERYWRLVS